MSTATLNFRGSFCPESSSLTEGQVKADSSQQSIVSKAYNWLRVEALFRSLELISIFVSDEPTVKNYLVEHFDMTKVVWAACVAAVMRLNSSDQLTVELYRDPEEDNEHLVLFVRQEEYDENIMDTIDKINEDFESDLEGKSGWLLVTTDFKRPRRNT